MERPLRCACGPMHCDGSQRLARLERVGGDKWKAHDLRGQLQPCSHSMRGVWLPRASRRPVLSMRTLPAFLSLLRPAAQRAGHSAQVTTRR